MKKILILFCFSLACQGADFQDFARAIHQTETGGKLGAIKGDAGKALGPLQIHKICWLDVQSKVGGKYEDCAGLEYSKLVLFFYCQRYEKRAMESGDWLTCARLWNGGAGHKTKTGKARENLEKYAAKVKKNLTNSAQ